MTRAGARGLVLVACLSARGASAQEFSAPAPPWSESAAGLLERGLAPRRQGWSFESLATRWLGLSELATASVAAGGSWRALRLAAGASHTGEGEIAWSALALAAGWTGDRAGVGLRACARSEPGPPGAPPARGIEVGVGAWALAAPGARVWASAPQLWRDGESAPLDRPLEIGALARILDLDLWISRAVSPGEPTGLRGEHSAGLAARAGPLGLWAELRDRPARGAVGLEARAGGLRVAFSVEDHPLLGETVRLEIAAGGAGP